MNSLVLLYIINCIKFVLRFYGNLLLPAENIIKYAFTNNNIYKQLLLLLSLLHRGLF